jgi:sec-independent protein translocase protein TatA
MAMFGLGMPEIIIIFFAFILLFGARSLPEAAKGLAQAIKSFKKGMSDLNDEPEKKDVEKKDQAA